jgi:glycosyltransferase involved in cell wall biosynthesis
MRIAHVLAGRYGRETSSGVEKAVYHLSRAQSELGNEVAVFALTSEGHASSHDVRVYSAPESHIPFAVPGSLKTALEAWSPAIVHFHSVYIPAFANLARRLRRLGVPYAVTPHGALSPFVMSRRSYLKRGYRIAVELPLLNHAAFVHAVGDQEDIVAYGVNAPIVFAPNGVELRAIPARMDHTRILQRRPGWHDARVLVFIGRLDPFHKGLDLLLRGFRKALEETPRLRLVLVGPDYRGGEQVVRRLISLLCLDEHVLLWGPAFGDEKYDLLASGDVFVLTSRWEGGPIALLEAMAFGKPCLVTNAADRRRAIEHSGAGWVIGADVDEIASAMRDLARQRNDALRAIGARARELVCREFTWPRTAETLVQGYARFVVNRSATEPLSRSREQANPT